MVNPACWFEIYVQDMQRAKAFYEGVFECELSLITEDGLKMWSFPSNQDKYGAPGALVEMEGVPSGGNSTLVYFGCEDCAVEEQRVEQLGGKICRTKFAIGEYGFISLVTDSEGNMIGLHSQK